MIDTVTVDDDQDLINHFSNYFSPEDFNSKFNSNLPNSASDTNNMNFTKYFSLLHLNARSLNKNFDALELLLTSVKHFPFSIIGITETWLNSNSPAMFNLHNYELLRADRAHGKGGGVGMYIHDQLKVKRRPDLHITGAEDLFIEIVNDKHKNIIVGTIYRPPNNVFDPFLQSFDEELHKILHENKNVYLMGDYNIDLLSTTQQNSPRFINVLQSNAFYPHINKPTRICNTSHTLIDNIFSNVYHNSTNGIIYSDISDHLPIFVICNHTEYQNSTQINCIKFYRKETQTNIDSLIVQLAQEEWHDVYNEADVNKSYDNFIQKLISHYNEHIPLIKSNNRKNNNKMPWITKGILCSIHTRNRLYKTSLRHPTFLNKDRYKKIRNKLTTLIRLSRKLYYSNKLANNNNLNKVWQTINELIKNSKKSYPDTMNTNGVESNDPIEISNMFNEYFTNIGPKLASTVTTNTGHFTQHLSNNHNKSLFFIPTNNGEILKVVQSLKPSKSCGHDEISVKLLKKIIFYIVSPLTHIFNLSLSSGIFPNSLKIAKIVPIHKKDDPSLIENYRPISILPAISKILEKIAYNRLYKFLTDNNLLNTNQFGFRKGYSTDYAIIQSCDKIIDTLVRKEHIIGIFLDLSKAFDTIDHKILINKLSYYGVRGIILSWFNDYLSNRKQYVNFLSNNSSKSDITCGVPPGINPRSTSFFNIY